MYRWIFLPLMKKTLRREKSLFHRLNREFKKREFYFMEYELTNQWLKKANDDYTSAKILMEKVLPPQIEIVCYHCQQCAEKALKAFCVYKKAEVQRTHNLIVLCQQCIALDSGFSVLISDCARLTPYSVQTRYPNNTIQKSLNLRQKQLLLWQRKFMILWQTRFLELENVPNVPKELRVKYCI